jgi:LmbE family N-acetylglucosaminyl deacetylase
MKRLFSFFLITGILLAGCSARKESGLPASIEGIPHIQLFTKDDRLLILAPHPDDESIGCAGIIQDARFAGAQVRVAYLTNGEHNQFAFIVYEKRLPMRQGEFIYLGGVRRAESIRAMQLLGVTEKDLVFFGYPDSGMFRIFSAHWDPKHPSKSWLTRVSKVPYKDSPSYGAPYTGQNVLKDLETVLREYKPTRIFVSHPADTNLDHRSLYLFLQVALLNLGNQIPAPLVQPYLIHCVGWPLPRHYHPVLNLLPPQRFKNSQINWSAFGLSAMQLHMKRRAILCYKSQTETAAFYLLAFARKNELFGDYPVIQLKHQHPAPGAGIEYSGISSMYRDSEIGIIGPAPTDEHVGNVSYAVVDDYFLAHVQKDKELNDQFSLILYLFGWQAKTPFADMPKISILTKNNKFKVFNSNKLIPADGVSVDANRFSVTIKIPLALLGDPEYILTSFKARWGILPVDASAFRKIQIQQ